MQKIIVPFGIIGILIVCWVTGVIRAIPTDYSEKIAEYEKFAEEQVDLEAYGSGIEYYHKIIKLDASPIYYKRLGEIYDMADRSSEGYELLVECISMHPQEIELYQQIIHYYFDQMDYKTCAKHIENYNKIHPMDDEIRNIYYQCKYRFEVKSKGYEFVNDCFNNKILVKDMEQYFYLNKKLKKISLPDLGDASPDFKDLLGVTVDGHPNFIDNTGLKYLDAEVDYRKTWSFSNNVALVEKENGTYGYVNKQFRFILEDFIQATQFFGGVAGVQTQEGWKLINNLGEQLGKDTYEDIKFDDNRICSLSQRVFAKKEGRYIMLDIEGKQVGETSFDDVKPFNSGKYAAVKQEGVWGFVNTNNQIVIEPQYEDANSFGEDLAAVSIDGKWGFISHINKIAIEPQFEGAKHLNSGIAPVKRDGLWYVLVIGK